MELEYIQGKKISIRKHYDEKWLQNRIEENPEILGLGELDLIERERKQSSGGKIDFLFLKSAIQTMYEVEIQLGSTDPSHIIRAIEYWDIESRRFPSKEHKAVLIAEDINNRFFNVISLMSRSIPIIAIQVSAIQIENKILLNFTKVLDTFEVPEDEEKLAGEQVSRPYWEKKCHKESIRILDESIELSKTFYTIPRITYNKHHIALGTERQNYMWFHPRKSARIYFEIKVDIEDIELLISQLEELDMSVSQRKQDLLSVSISAKEFDKHKNEFMPIISNAIDMFK